MFNFARIGNVLASALALANLWLQWLVLGDHSRYSSSLDLDSLILKIFPT